MGALIPLLIAAAPAAVTALTVGAARGFGGVVGKAAGDATVEAATGVIKGFQSLGQPQGSGQQRVVLMTASGPVY